MIHFPESVIEDHNIAWSERTPASVIIFLEDARCLLKSVNAPEELVKSLEKYLETLDHSLDQDSSIDNSDSQCPINKSQG